MSEKYYFSNRPGCWAYAADAIIAGINAPFLAPAVTKIPIREPLKVRIALGDGRKLKIWATHSREGKESP